MIPLKIFNFYSLMFFNAEFYIHVRIDPCTCDLFLFFHKVKVPTNCTLVSHKPFTSGKLTAYDLISGCNRL